MSEGPRYWDEKSQRWEDADGTASAGPPTVPDQTPTWISAQSPGTAQAPGTAQSPDTPQSPDTAQPSPTAADTPAVPPVSPTPPAPETPTPPHVLPAPPPPVFPGGGWSPTPAPVPAPALAPSGRPSRRLVWSVIVGAAAVGVAVSLVLTLVVNKGHKQPDEASSPPSSAVTSAAPTTASASPSPSPSLSTHRLPAGYESYDDPQGFRIARPKGWSRSTVASAFGIDVVNYSSPDRRHRVQVYQIAEDSPDASFELFLSDRTPKAAGFRKLSLVDLNNGGLAAARLEYLADTIKGEPAVGTWHIYDERFEATDGSIYAIAAYGPDADGRSDELRLLTNALTWFCPSGASCATPAG